MKTTNLEKNSPDLNWADYFDSLINEAWMESQKASRLGMHSADLEVLRPEAFDEIRESKN